MTTPTSVYTCIIKPTTKHNRPLPSPPTISLHGLDLLCPPVHISNHRFFHRPPEPMTKDDVISRLKSALAEALEFYPPVAGTVRANEKGVPYIALDGEGAIFQVDNRDTPFVDDGEDLSPRTEVVLPTPAHPLAVRVTQFSCGTVAVCSSLHHWLADLRGFLDFLATWAKIARGETVDPQTIPLDWSRNPARFFPAPSTSPSPPPPPKGYRVLPAVSAEVPVFVPVEAQSWKITENSLAKLKNDFTPNSSDTWISSGDALTALLWGVITRARESAKVPHACGRSSEDAGTETIATAADGRERSQNKCMMGGKYFANFNLLFTTTVPRSDLLSIEKDACSRVALALRASLAQQLTPASIAQRIAFFEEPENVVPPCRIVWSSDVTFTNWCHSDLQGPDMDFGWGKPFDATAGAGMVPGGFGRLLLHKSSGEIKILISVEKEGATAMRNDPLLNKYASFVKIIH